jgi:hypothetical protein
MEMSTKDKVLDVIVDYKKAHGGNAPTYAEISEVVGIGRTTVFHYIQQLIKDEKVTRVDGKLVVHGEVYIAP